MFGPAFAFMSSVTWAIGTTGYSRLTREYSPFSVSFLRSLVALPLFFICSFIFAGGWSAGWNDFALVDSKHMGWFALSMFASYGFGDVLFLFSTKSLGVPGALAIASIYPLWTAVMGLFLGQTLTKTQGFGLILTLASVATVILTTKDNSKKDKVALGLLLAFLTSLLWAINGYAVNRGAQGLTTSVSNTLRMGFAALMTPFFGILLTPKSSLFLPAKEIKGNLWLFFTEAFCGSMFFTYGLAHSPLAIGSTLASLAPVLSVPATWALGIEKPSLKRTSAIFGVVIGLALLVG